MVRLSAEALLMYDARLHWGGLAAVQWDALPGVMLSAGAGPVLEPGQPSVWKLHAGATFTVR